MLYTVDFQKISNFTRLDAQSDYETMPFYRQSNEFPVHYSIQSRKYFVNVNFFYANFSTVQFIF